jgi:two-component system cell cycle response regulator
VGGYGGEEFMLVLATDGTGARTLAERCRQRLEARPVMLASGEQITMTASFGLCTLGPGIADAEAMIRLADHALYRAKGSGRNRVEMAALPAMLH